MTIQEILFLFVVFIVYIFGTITDFGGSLLAMPTSILLIGINDAKTVLIIGSCMTITNFKYINKKYFFNTGI